MEELMAYLLAELKRCQASAEEFHNPDETEWIEKCIALVEALEKE